MNAAMTGMRQVMVWLHRYVGLALAGFLVVAGLTGSVLAWNDELEAWISPQLFHASPPAPDRALIDTLQLRAQVQQAYPHALVARAPLSVEPGRSVLFTLRKIPAATGKAVVEPASDQVFVDPYTGAVLGERKWGDLSQGMKNLMPFVYRLHYSLALGATGTVVFGLVALLWTLDCFVGAWLTLPRPSARPGRQPARAWLARWSASWKLRRGSAYQLHVDLHRAGGLWTWAMLLVLAWSSVAFNLPQVYEPVMKAALAHQPDLAALPRPAQARLQPLIGWEAARALGRQRMAEQARLQGFSVQGEIALTYEPVRGFYRYDVKSSRDLRDRGANTRMALDGDTGELKGLWLPTGAASGDTLRTWITNLHMATFWGLPMKLFICALGLVVAMLSITGLVIWSRKRKARHAHKGLAFGARSPERISR